MQQAVKILDAKTAMENNGNQWKQLETIQVWQLEKVKSKQEVILKAQRDKSKNHFALLMDLCHVKNTELEQNFRSREAESYSEGHCKR